MDDKHPYLGYKKIGNRKICDFFLIFFFESLVSTKKLMEHAEQSSSLNFSSDSPGSQPPF